MYKNLIPSIYQTVKWRKNQLWYKNGLKNECEIYQKNIIENITKTPIKKTYKRFNLVNYNFEIIKNPYLKMNQYEYSENMDGYQKIGDCDIYYNLKMISCKGGFQYRSLQNTYFFIKCQLEYLKENEYEYKTIKFVNILDGAYCYQNIDKFNYLKNQEKYNIIKKNIYIGDSYDYEKWFNQNIIYKE
jgi:hypothetical protein